MSITIAVTKEISTERIKDLLCAAFEGGINDWAAISVAQKEIDKVKAEYYHEVPALGGKITFYDKEEVADLVLGMETATPLGILDLESIKNALQAMANGEDLEGTKIEHLKDHFNDFITENEDAETADVVVQIAVMGKIVYG
jgi:hypothetical protein